MDPTQQSQQPNEDNNNGSYGGGGAKGSFLCRQSSARWTPTTEQIRILKDLYYNNGVRSPTADQIQRISARLRQYGKIEGKNVFYWFQNHKARERQKKRFISDHLISPLPSPTTQQQQQQQQLRSDSTVASSTVPPASSNRKPELDYKNKFPCNITAATTITPAASSSSAGVFSVGNYGYGSMTMEKCFRECSISPKAKRTTGGSKSYNFGWIGGNNIYDPYKPSCNFYGHETKPTLYEDLEEEEEEEEAEEEACGVETLPLFPMRHGDFDGGYPNGINYNNSSAATNYYFSNGGGSYTSLELSLNSFFGHSPDSL